MSVYKYLDLSTSHLTEAEMDAVSERLAAIDEATPRVITHEYGAWVNVPELVTSDDMREDRVESLDELAKTCPNLAACLQLARQIDCKWINFDQDAEERSDLPRFEW
jgi:hypothetical protein